MMLVVYGFDFKGCGLGGHLCRFGDGRASEKRSDIHAMFVTIRDFEGIEIYKSKNNNQS